MSIQVTDQTLENPILDVDSYKPSHWLQYPPKTTNVFSYVMPRGGVHKKLLFQGLQIFLKKYATKRITMRDVDEAEIVWKAHGEPFNRAGWERVVNVYGGRLPLKIRAVREGSVIPNQNVMVTIESTDPELFWLVSYIETAILRAIWYPVTVASVSWSIKQVIKAALEKTGDLAGLLFKLHDFGARGVSSKESAGIGGCAHLVNFMGSDTITGALYAMRYYNADQMVAFSIPAAEHSSITSWKRVRETEAYRNMIDQFGGEGKMFAVVSDSYDIFNAVKNIWGGELKQRVIDSGSMVVIRPDSGDPTSVVYETVKLLDEAFGSTVNAKGYKVLNHVRVIQGDGINEESIISIIEALIEGGYSIDNVAFGMGGALLQQVNRDTDKFAMKASAALVAGEWVDVYKDPITDKGKSSLKGRVTLWFNERTGEYVTDLEDRCPGEGWSDALVEVFRDGEILVEYTFDEVRARST